MKYGSSTKITYTSIFQESTDSSFWKQEQFTEKPDLLQQIYQTKFYVKSEQEIWEQCIIELYPDKLYKEPIDQMSHYLFFCTLQACLLKKITVQDCKLHPFKFGFKLTCKPQTVLFGTNSADAFKKIYLILRRYCILEKYSRKYKCLTKLKTIDFLLGNASKFYQSVRFSDN